MGHLKPATVKIGDKSGELTIVKYKGVQMLPEGYKTHHFDARCSCNAYLYDIPQHRLKGRQRINRCKECGHDFREAQVIRANSKRGKPQKWHPWCIFHLWPAHPTDRGFIITH